MKLINLLKNVKCRVFGNSLIEIEGLYHNDKDVNANGLFFCIKGKNSNGIDFINNAINNGAVAIVVEHEIKVNKKITQIIVKNIRKTMSLIACNFYNNPAKKLKIIGVTGTNGKTTTTYMIANLINSYDQRCAIIGTNGVIFNDQIIETNMTTPDPIELQKIFFKLNKSGIKYVAMEVSAHAIALNKLDGFVFELMIFTNLTEDHLDYFETMDKYFEAKKSIFLQNHTKKALINTDDFYGKNIFQSINFDKYSYAKNSVSDYKFKQISQENDRQLFQFLDQKIETNFLGIFNLYNLAAAISCLDILDFKINNIQNKIENLKNVPGRFNTILVNKRLFVVDYAHTPDGLENVIKLCNDIKNDKNLICVFGCGGNRETQKRSKMGEISSKFADFTIISSDNPRFENRENIAKDIEIGMINLNYKIILDRSEAIKYAYKISKTGDVILVAGKGNENYIDEKGVKIYYSDYDEIEKLRREND